MGPRIGPVGVLFDTNIVIDFLIGIPGAETELNRNPPNHISIVTWIEVMAGSEYQAQDTRTVLANFTVLPLTQPIAERAAVLRRERRTLKLPDAIILATAQTGSRILVTRNTRDFDPADAAIHIPYAL